MTFTSGDETQTGVDDTHNQSANCQVYEISLQRKQDSKVTLVLTTSKQYELSLNFSAVTS